MTTPEQTPHESPIEANTAAHEPTVEQETPTPAQPTAAPPSAFGCLTILGWMYLPYIMLPLRWRKLSKNRRIVGSIWVAVIFAGIIMPTFVDPPVDRSNVQSAPVADTQPAPPEQSAGAAENPCAAELRRFASDVRTVSNRAFGLQRTMQKYIDNTHTARELEVRVPAAYGDLRVIDVPTCRSEPAEIVAALNRVRDAQLLAFIEMTAAASGGSSREAALAELAIQMPVVERELEVVESMLNAIE